MFGSEPDPDDPVLVQASPVNHASADDAPMFLIHGTEDLVVPFSQSQALFDALGEAGAEASFLMVENAGHELEPSGGPIQPSEGAITDRIADFFEDQL